MILGAAICIGLVTRYTHAIRYGTFDMVSTSRAPRLDTFGCLIPGEALITLFMRAAVRSILDCEVIPHALIVPPGFPCFRAGTFARMLL